MKRWTLALLALWAVVGAGGPAVAVRAPAPSPPVSSLEIAPGERIELKLAPDGVLTILSRGPLRPADTAGPPTSDYRFEALAPVRVAAPPPIQDQLTVSLSQSPDQGARLKVVNGYGEPIIYQAALIFERNGARSYRPTSICPVRGGGVGLEGWGDSIAGISLTQFRKIDPEHLACNDGSILTKSAGAPSAERYVCVGGETKGSLSPLTVSLIVDATGAIMFESTTWRLPSPDLMHSPTIGFDYAMEGDRVAGKPAAARVMAAVGTTPMPTASTAEIVLLLNGVEKARRPWRLYEQNMAALRGATQRPVAFFGVIPFSPSREADDDGLRTVLAAVGESGGSVEVRILGNDGSVIADGSYAISAPLARQKPLVQDALQQALTLAKTPTQCRKLAN